MEPNAAMVPGGFDRKFNLGRVYMHFKESFQVISQVHALGAVKYGFYSFQNTPETSNSTVEDNLNAMVRHYLCVTTGTIMDKEGFAHAHQMMARAHMLLTTWYRNEFGRLLKFKKPAKFPIINAASSLCAQKDSLPGWEPSQISSEALCSIVKWDTEDPLLIPDIRQTPLALFQRQDRDLALESKIMLLLQEFMLNFQDKLYTSNCSVDEPGELYNKILPIDWIFMLACAGGMMYCHRNDLLVTDKQFSDLIGAKQKELRDAGIDHLEFNPDGSVIKVPFTAPGTDTGIPESAIYRGTPE